MQWLRAKEGADPLKLVLMRADHWVALTSELLHGLWSLGRELVTGKASSSSGVKQQGNSQLVAALPTELHVARESGHAK